MRTTCWTHLGSLAVLAASAVCSGQTVPLEFAPLELPEATLTQTDFAHDGTLPVLYYYGMVVPAKNRLNFSEKTPKQTLELGGSKCTIAFDPKGRTFRLDAGKTDAALKRRRHGLTAPAFRLGKLSYRLAMPRAFTYLGKGAIYYRSGGAQTGTVAGTNVAIYDANVDGRYEAKHDAIRLGRCGAANAFAPIGDFLATTGTVYRIGKIAADGSQMSLAAHDGDVGRMKLGAPVRGVAVHVAVASTDGKVTFAGAAKGQTLTVLPGKYTLRYGFLFDPKSREIVTLIIPDKKMGAVTVPKYVVPEPPKPKIDPKTKKPLPTPKPPPPPEPTAFTVGEGLSLQFAYAKKDDKIVVSGPVVATGRLGERYVGRKMSVRAYVLKERPAEGKDKKKPKPITVEIGRFTVGGDLKGGEHACEMPKVKDKPLKGKCILRLVGSLPGFGTVTGEKPIGL